LEVKPLKVIRSKTLRVEPHDRISALIRRERDQSSLSYSCEDTERREQSENLKQSPYQKSDHAGTLIWNSQPPEL